VIYVRDHTQNPNTIDPYLEQIKTNFGLKIPIRTDINALCKQRCATSEWRNTLLCQICQNTPVAQFVEGINY